jgi:hypothetical protein
MPLDTNFISWLLTIIAATAAVYFNFKSSKRDDNKERRSDEIDLITNIKVLLQEYRVRLETLTKERDDAAQLIINLRAEILLLEQRIRDMRLEVLELNQIIIKTARDNLVK